MSQLIRIYCLTSCHRATSDNRQVDFQGLPFGLIMRIEGVAHYLNHVLGAIIIHAIIAWLLLQDS